MPLKPEGKTYTINGKQVMLYPISTLAQRLSVALGDERTTQTVRKWEVKGVIPPAIFRSGQKRLFANEQIECICRIARECNIRQGYSLSLTDFSTRVWAEMKEVNRKLLGKE